MRKEDTYPDVDWRRPGGAPAAPLSPEESDVVAWQTAISRDGPSWPVLVLKGDGWLRGALKILDYGSGRGADAEYLGCDAWDPHWGPQELDRRRRWDRVLLTYVLNVLPRAERHEALLAAWALVKSGGWLLVSTRGDVKAPRKGRGGCTQFPTAGWCRQVLPSLPGAYRCSEPRTGRIWAIQKT